MYYSHLYAPHVTADFTFGLFYMKMNSILFRGAFGPDDFPRRLQFVERFLRQTHDQPQFPSSDIFTLNLALQGKAFLVRESSTQWDKGFIPYKEFHYNIYIDNTLKWCHYETIETQRLISRSLTCVEWRNNGFWWAKVIGSVPL